VVCGVKGGVGVTAVSANLAAALSGDGDTALLALPGASSEDLGLWFASSEGGKGACVMEALKSGTPELLGEAGRRVPGNIFLLETGEESGKWGRDDVVKLAGLLERRFAWAVLDLGNWRDLNSGSPWLAALEKAAVVLRVVTPDPMAIRKLRRMEETSDGKYPFVSVLNRRSEGSARTAFGTASGELPADLAFSAMLTESRELGDAMLEGRPVVSASPHSRAADEFVALAEMVRTKEGKTAGSAASVDDSAYQTGAFRSLKRKLHQKFLERLRGTGREVAEGDEDLVERGILALIEEEQLPDLTPGFRDRLLKELKDEALGLGPLQDLLDDPEVTEIMVNGPSHIFSERGGRISREPKALSGEEELRAIIERIVAPLGRRIDESSPLVDARLKDGSRVNAVIPPLALEGSCLTIRKFAKRRLTTENLIERGSLTRQSAAFLKSCVAAKVNVLISGGTGSGKTTLLNILASFVGGSERIVTIEDAAELSLPQEHVVRLEARPANLEGRGAVSIRDLVRNSLRMRPDRIVVGEVRGGEALDMLQAMNTGHEGSLSTLHANSPRDALSRLETMVLMAGLELPLRAIREQIVSAIELIVQIARQKDGSRRVTRITEVTGLEGDVYVMQDVFVRREEGGVAGELEPAGLVPKVAHKLKERGEILDRGMFLT